MDGEASFFKRGGTKDGKTSKSLLEDPGPPPRCRACPKLHPLLGLSLNRSPSLPLDPEASLVSRTIGIYRVHTDITVSEFC